MSAFFPILIFIAMVLVVLRQFLRTTSTDYQRKVGEQAGDQIVEQVAALPGESQSPYDDLRNIIDIAPETALQIRREEITQAHGVAWNEWESKARIAGVTGTASAQFSDRSRFFGPLSIQRDEDKILVFDWLYRFKNGTGGYKHLCHTVVTIVTPKLDVPDFYIRPPEFHTRHRLSRFTEIKTDTTLDHLFVIESLLSSRTKTLFRSELAFRELIPFICERDWTIEWTGDRLAVYRLGEIVSADQIKHLLLEVTELLELIKRAPEEMVRQFDLEYGFA